LSFNIFSHLLYKFTICQLGFKRKIYSLKDASNSSILNEKLVREYEILKAQAIDLNSTLTKFTKGNENLYIITGNQRYVFEKSGLGYNPKRNEKLYSTFFVRASTSSTSYLSCCRNSFHEKYCMHKIISTGTKHIWMLKSTFTNLNKLMRLWIPKSICWDFSL